MPLTNYSELKDSVSDWLNRDDLAAVVPDFIALAEADIGRSLRHWRQEKRVSASADEAYEILPDDWLEMIELRHQGGDLLRQLGSVDMARFKADAGGPGKPVYYRLSAGQIEFFPEPDTSYPLEMSYYARIPALSDSVPTNWLLSEYPDVLLYGALMQAAPYLHDDQRLAVWAGLFKTAMDKLTGEGEAARFSGPLRMKVRAYG